MFKKIFKFLTRKRKADNQAVSVTAEAKHKEIKMENEKEVVETKEEVKQPEVEVEVEKKEEAETPVAETENVVSETEEKGNGISIDDVVTKDFLKEMLDGFSAKLDAVLNENKDLKEKLAEKETENGNLKEKYENHDFGNTAKKGVQAKDTKSIDTFEEYSKQFM